MPPKLAEPHGRYSTYTNKGCRCAPCNEAARAYERERNKQPGGRRAHTRQRVERSPWAPLQLGEWMLQEMAANGEAVVQCDLCFCYMIKKATEGGGYTCRRKAACKARQRRLGGWVQGDLFVAPKGAHVVRHRRKVIPRRKGMDDAIEDVAASWVVEQPEPVQHG